MTDSSTGYIVDRRAPQPLANLPWWVMPGLAAIVLAIFAGALIASCFLADNTLRTQMFTGAFGLATAVVAYFFGSSVGEKRKDDAAAVDSAKKTDALASSAPLATVTSTTLDPGPPATATTTTTQAPIVEPTATATATGMVTP